MKRWKHKKKEHFFINSCLSHCFEENIVTNPRWILKKWRRFMFLRCPNIKPSLTFLTAIMGWEILNNIGKQFVQKLPVKSSFYRGYCGKLGIHLKKMKEVFVTMSPIYKKISHILRSYFRMRDTCTYLQPIFQTL